MKGGQSLIVPHIDARPLSDEESDNGQAAVACRFVDRAGARILPRCVQIGSAGDQDLGNRFVATDGGGVKRRAEGSRISNVGSMADLLPTALASPSKTAS
jgi:hypothetical protein